MFSVTLISSLNKIFALMLTMQITIRCENMSNKKSSSSSTSCFPSCVLEGEGTLLLCLPHPLHQVGALFGFPFKSKDGKDAYGKFYFKSAGHRQLASSFVFFFLILYFENSTSTYGIKTMFSTLFVVILYPILHTMWQ
jgi:hypothetical protein